MQFVWIFTGAGENGKSFFIENIIRPALGDFFATASTQLLTRKRENANQTNEALMDILDKWLVAFSEADQSEVLRANTIKNMTGEDHLTTRGNYGSQVQVKPVFKSIIVCNEIPKLSEDSYAIWRRVKVVDWPTTFTSNPDRNDPSQRSIDTDLKNKAKEWPPYFAGCCIHWLKLYRDQKLSHPPSVEKHTQLYKENNNPFLKFVDDYLSKMSDDVHRLTLNDIKKRAEDFIGSKLTTNLQEQLEKAIKTKFSMVKASHKYPRENGRNYSGYIKLAWKLD